MAHYLLTGAGGGIGRALIRHLRDHELTLVGRDATRLAAAQAEVPDAVCVQADLSTQSGADTLAQILATRPALDGAVHAVGSLMLKPLHRLTLEEWRATTAANLDSAFLVLQQLVKGQLASPHPCSAVFFSSVAASVGLINHEAIAAAKAGLEGLVRSAAASYAASGLRVNAIAPALTETPLTANLTSHAPTRQAITAMHPLGRLGTADDQARAAAFLLSPEAGWITGQVLGVDGGLGRLRGR